MRRRIIVLFVVAFASVFGAACGGGAGQQELEILEARVAALEKDVANQEAAVENLKVVAGTQWAEGQKQEKTQP